MVNFAVRIWLGPKYYVLPVLVLGARPMCLIFRLLDEEIQQVVRADYITTARAKGVYGCSAMGLAHSKKCFISIDGIFGSSDGRVINGVVCSGNYFAIPGVGTYLIESIGEETIHC